MANKSLWLIPLLALLLIKCVWPDKPITWDPGLPKEFNEIEGITINLPKGWGAWNKGMLPQGILSQQGEQRQVLESNGPREALSKDCGTAFITAIVSSTPNNLTIDWLTEEVDRRSGNIKNLTILDTKESRPIDGKASMRATYETYAEGDVRSQAMAVFQNAGKTYQLHIVQRPNERCKEGFLSDFRYILENIRIKT